MNRPSDHELDLSVATMLRFGITLSASVVIIGGLLYLRHPWASVPNYTHFIEGGASRSTIPGIWKSAAHLNPRGIIQLGLVLLIATPIARVIFCVIGFARQRSGLYVAVSTIVLAILLYSLTKGVR